MKVVAILQARTASRRLPAKALLPVAGLPSAVLSARRAGNRGLPVRLATSIDPTDDVLSAAATAAGLPVVRGPLDDVLGRFVQTAEDLQNEDVVIRLTADNLLPDGAFIEELLAFRQAAGADYIGTHSPLDGLPYGVSAEAFSVKLLRAAHVHAVTPREREHVTPWMRSGQAPALFRPVVPRDWSHLRATLDAPDDYQRITRLFREEPDPIRVTWRDLCDRLERSAEAHFRVPYRIKRGQVVSRLTMGSAQLGLDRYGIANRAGRPARGAVRALVRTAVAHGVTEFDTAQAYGDAESALGDALASFSGAPPRVVTKLAPLDWLPEDSPDEAVRVAVEHSVYASCHRLRVAQLDVLMLHRYRHLDSHGGLIWRTLLELQQQGVVRDLGVSISTPEQAIRAFDIPALQHIQLPFNLLDDRWLRAGIPARCAARPELTIYARSAFLQGLLLLESGAWPVVSRDQAAAWSGRLDEAVRACGRLDRADLCLAYVLAQSWIDSIVVGMETMAQLEHNLERICRPPLDEAQCVSLAGALSGLPDALLDPSRWETAGAPT